MRTLLLIAISTLLFAFNTTADNPVERLGVKGPLEFNKTNFKLVWTDHPNPGYYIQEYLPVGEKPGSFNQMLTIHLFETDIDTKEAVAKKIKELTARKKIDAVCNYQVTESPDANEYIVDFLLGESKGDQITIVEFNIYRYKQIEIDNKKAIVVYAYSKRSYGDDIVPFFGALKEDRVNYLNQMISVTIPKVAIESK